MFLELRIPDNSRKLIYIIIHVFPQSLQQRWFRTPNSTPDHTIPRFYMHVISRPGTLLTTLHHVRPNMRLIRLLVRRKPDIPVNSENTIFRRQPVHLRFRYSQRRNHPVNEILMPGLYSQIPLLMRIKPLPVIILPQLFQKPEHFRH